MRFCPIALIKRSGRLPTSTQKIPSITKNGRFATIAYQLTHFDNIAANLAALEKIKAARKKINRKSNQKIKKYTTWRVGERKKELYIKKKKSTFAFGLALIAN